jgi:hypothetical protein
MYDFTNVDPVKCCTWLVLPTVYDESLSYGEQLNKFCKALNELIENNNNLPDYVAEMIQNYITSGAIDEVIRNVLANYILNVKYPPKGITPAVGDGSADDTDAIQGCIDYAFNQGGGCVYFPYGKYLTRSLTLRSGVSLVGFDRYSTRIVQRGGDTKPLVSGGNVQNVQISNLTLDGNNGVQTDDLDVVNVLGKDCLFTNLVIKSGYQCFVYNGLGGDLQVDNIVFGGAVKKVAVINGKDSVQFTNVKFNELGKVQGECVLEVGASDGVYSFSSKAISPLCISVNGSRNTFNCDIINASSNFNDTGVMNNFNVLGVEVKEQLAQDKYSSTGGSVTESVNGSKTETIGSDKVENISGSKTETIGSDKVENVSGSKNETVTENKTENIIGNREIDINGTDSVHIDGVSSFNAGGTRTEVYADSRNVGVTGVNIEEYHNSMTENFDKKHIVNGSDETNTFTGNVTNKANKFSFTSTEKTLPFNFPDKSVDLYNLKLTPDYLFTPSNTDNIADELNELLKITSVSLSSGNYTITKPILIPVGKTLNGNNAIINKSFTDYGVIIGNDPTLGDTNYAITGLFNITINCNNAGSGVLINSKRCNLQNIKIRNSVLSGIDIFKPDYSGSPSDCQINNIDIFKDDGATYSNYGMRIYGSDNNISNVRTLFTKIGFYISDKGASTFFTDCHPLAFSSEIDGWLDSVGWDDYSSSTFISNCYADNFCTCYRMNNQNSILSICNLKYFCWEYNRNATRTFLLLNSGCFVNGIGLDAPNHSTVKKVNFGTNYFYLGTDRINLSFVSPNEPNVFNENDYGNLSLYRFYNKYFKEFNNNSSKFHLVGICKLLRPDMMCSSINIIADEFSINGLTVSKAGTINKGTGTNTDLTVEIRKAKSDNDTNTIYIYVKYSSGYFGRCLCEVSNNFLMLPRLYEPSTEPDYILGTINYKTEPQA